MSEGSDGETVVVVDVHEPEALRVLSLSHPDVAKWTEEPLDAADLVVNGVGFERKTPSDYASSVVEDRLAEQIAKLGEMYDSAYILLEGGFDDFNALTHSQIQPESLRGHAASTTVRHGISVIPTGGTPGTETAQRLLIDMALRLGRKHTEEPTSGYLESSVVGSDEPLGKRLWGCFDGLGPKLAGRLYEDLGSPLGLDATAPSEVMVDALSRTEGIGSKRAQRIAEAFQNGYDPNPSSGERNRSRFAHSLQSPVEGEEDL